MADKTMPPVSENLDAPSMDDPMGATAPDMAPPAQPAADEGSVMVNIPKAAFDSMHQIIMQLASGLDQLAKDVNQQAAGSKSEAMPPEAPAAPASSEMPESGSGTDEEFLNKMAEEASARSR
jgi:hypothetical protein